MSFLKYLKEEFYSKIYNDEVYLNANREEIKDIIHNDGGDGVRIGVVSEDEIYYWPSGTLHSDMQRYLKKPFKIRLTYDHKIKKIFDYESEDGGYDNEKYYKVVDRDFILKIVRILNDIFNRPDYASYMNIESDAPKNRYHSLITQFHEEIKNEL